MSEVNQNDIAIEVSHVSKHFKVFMDRGHTLKELAIFSNRRRFEMREVLDDISFSVHRGEAVGLIGHNGCGKSTTLKLLTRIMYPDKGTITMRGRVSSLIELGAGFHPDMSGRENIYINASIFGLTRKEIDARLDSIIAFSELEDYIDNPVRTYSSGMYMRLAFSVAINVSADILLIDEILAVGDAGFQAKCFNKMREIKQEGTTIVLVSHSMGQVEQLCDRSIWINEGKIVMEGPCKEVNAAYLDYMVEDRERRTQGVIKQEIERGAKMLNVPADLDSIRHAGSDVITTVAGFHDNEVSEIDGMEFAWMSQKESALELSPNLSECDTLVRIPFHVSPRLDEPMTVSMTMNGQAIIDETQLYSDGAFFLPLRATDQPVKLGIKISHMWCPADVLGTSDTRNLGMQVQLGSVYLAEASELPEKGGIITERKL